MGEDALILMISCHFVDLGRLTDNLALLWIFEHQL
jgi:hypothetical protein